MNKFNELTIYKPNQLIEIEKIEGYNLEGGYMTPCNLVAYNYILLKLQKNGTNNIIISGTEFFNELKLSKHYDDLISYLNELRKISVVSRDSKGQLWGAFNLISAFKRLENGTFYLEVPNLIFKSLCKQDELYYTTIKLLEQKSFRCIYTMIFYEIFKKYEKINIPIYTVEQLKGITSTQNKYLEYKYFKRDVLEKAINEINEFNMEYEYYYEEERLGRKVHKIKFFKIPKYDCTISNNIDDDFSPTLKKVIKKVKQNKYIEKVFSKKALKIICSKYNEEDVIKALKEMYSYNFEIFNFSKFLVAKICDIIDSKSINKKKQITSNCSNLKEIIEIQQLNNNHSSNVVSISREDYEKLYELYLEKNSIPHMKSVRIGFERMNKDKFKIID